MYIAGKLREKFPDVLNPETVSDSQVSWAEIGCFCPLSPPGSDVLMPVQLLRLTKILVDRQAPAEAAKGALAVPCLLLVRRFHLVHTFLGLGHRRHSAIWIH